MLKVNITILGIKKMMINISGHQYPERIASSLFSSLKVNIFILSGPSQTWISLLFCRASSQPRYLLCIWGLKIVKRNSLYLLVRHFYSCLKILQFSSACRRILMANWLNDPIIFWSNTTRPITFQFYDFGLSN
jgi:hypothetical protein